MSDTHTHTSDAAVAAQEVAPTGRSVLAAFAWGIASMVWVLLYMYLLQVRGGMLFGAVDLQMYVSMYLNLLRHLSPKEGLIIGV